MAFAVRNLSVLAYANGFTLWHYKAGPDRLGRVEQPGFFGGAADMLAGGDLVMVSAGDGARMFAVAPQGAHADVAPQGAHADVAPQGAQADVAPQGAHADVAPRGARAEAPVMARMC